MHGFHLPLRYAGRAVSARSRADRCVKTARPRRFVFESFVCLADAWEYIKHAMNFPEAAREERLAQDWAPITVLD